MLFRPREKYSTRIFRPTQAIQPPVTHQQRQNGRQQKCNRSAGILPAFLTLRFPSLGQHLVEEL
jgi:hypothetical protein